MDIKQLSEGLYLNSAIERLRLQLAVKLLRKLGDF
jgi:hypothetical protein